MLRPCGGKKSSIQFNRRHIWIIASSGIIGLWLILRKFVPLLVVGLAYMVDQSAKIILEGFAFPLYASGKIDLHITLLQITSLIIIASLVV